MNSKEQLKPLLAPMFSSYVQENMDIEMILLATTDGFPILHLINEDKIFEADKMSAASSTLYSVSNAVTKQILNKRFQIAFIETEEGNVAFVSIPLDDRDFVLAMSAKAALNIASLRMFINRLSKEICELYLTNKNV